MTLPSDRQQWIVGVDLDGAALRRRVNDVCDLDEAILGDIQDPAVVKDRRFDLVYSAFVLEHVPDADKAISNLASWLKPGGLMVLQLPNTRSVYNWLS